MSISDSLTIDLSPWAKETVLGRWSSTVRSSLDQTKTDGGEFEIPCEVGVVAVVGGVEEGAREVVELPVWWI